jgi:hypothetical protein
MSFGDRASLARLSPIAETDSEMKGGFHRQGLLSEAGIGSVSLPFPNQPWISAFGILSDFGPRPSDLYSPP